MSHSRSWGRRILLWLLMMAVGMDEEGDAMVIGPVSFQPLPRDRLMTDNFLPGMRSGGSGSGVRDGVTTPVKAFPSVSVVPQRAADFVATSTPIGKDDGRNRGGTGGGFDVVANFHPQGQRQYKPYTVYPKYKTSNRFATPFNGPNSNTSPFKNLFGTDIGKSSSGLSAGFGSALPQQNGARFYTPRESSNRMGKLDEEKIVNYPFTSIRLNPITQISGASAQQTPNFDYNQPYSKTNNEFLARNHPLFSSGNRAETFEQINPFEKPIRRGAFPLPDVTEPITLDLAEDEQKRVLFLKHKKQLPPSRNFVDALRQDPSSRDDYRIIPVNKDKDLTSLPLPLGSTEQQQQQQQRNKQRGNGYRNPGQSRPNSRPQSFNPRSANENRSINSPVKESDSSAASNSKASPKHSISSPQRQQNNKTPLNRNQDNQSEKTDGADTKLALNTHNKYLKQNNPIKGNIPSTPVTVIEPAGIADISKDDLSFVRQPRAQQVHDFHNTNNVHSGQERTALESDHRRLPSSQTNQRDAQRYSVDVDGRQNDRSSQSEGLPLYNKDDEPFQGNARDSSSNENDDQFGNGQIRNQGNYDVTVVTDEKITKVPKIDDDDDNQGHTTANVNRGNDPAVKLVVERTFDSEGERVVSSETQLPTDHIGFILTEDIYEDMSGQDQANSTPLNPNDRPILKQKHSNNNLIPDKNAQNTNNQIQKPISSMNNERRLEPTNSQFTQSIPPAPVSTPSTGHPPEIPTHPSGPRASAGFESNSKIEDKTISPSNSNGFENSEQKRNDAPPAVGSGYLRWPYLGYGDSSGSLRVDKTDSPSTTNTVTSGEYPEIAESPAKIRDSPENQHPPKTNSVTLNPLLDNLGLGHENERFHSIGENASSFENVQPEVNLNDPPSFEPEMNYGDHAILDSVLYYGKGQHNGLGDNFVDIPSNIIEGTKGEAESNSNADRNLPGQVDFLVGQSIGRGNNDGEPGSQIGQRGLYGDDDERPSSRGQDFISDTSLLDRQLYKSDNDDGLKLGILREEDGFDRDQQSLEPKEQGDGVEDEEEEEEEEGEGEGERGGVEDEEREVEEANDEKNNDISTGLTNKNVFSRETDDHEHINLDNLSEYLRETRENDRTYAKSDDVKREKGRDGEVVMDNPVDRRDENGIPNFYDYTYDSFGKTKLPLVEKVGDGDDDDEDVGDDKGNDNIDETFSVNTDPVSSKFDILNAGEGSVSIRKLSNTFDGDEALKPGISVINPESSQLIGEHPVLSQNGDGFVPMSISNPDVPERSKGLEITKTPEEEEKEEGEENVESVIAEEVRDGGSDVIDDTVLISSPESEDHDQQPKSSEDEEESAAESDTPSDEFFKPESSYDKYEFATPSSDGFSAQSAFVQSQSDDTPSSSSDGFSSPQSSDSLFENQRTQPETRGGSFRSLFQNINQDYLDSRNLGRKTGGFQNSGGRGSKGFTGVFEGRTSLFDRQLGQIVEKRPSLSLFSRKR